MKQKVYCKNCKYYRTKLELITILTGLFIAVASYFVHSILLVFLFCLSAIIFLAHENKSCHATIKAYDITDTHFEHKEGMKVLDEYDLNCNNDCKHYEVK